MVLEPPTLSTMRWRSLARVAESALGLALLLHSIDIGAVAAVLAHANPELVLAAVAVGVLAQLSPMLPWMLLLPRHPGLGLPRLAGILLRAVFVGQLLPTGIGGDAVRSVEVGGMLGYGNALAAVAASRLMGMIGMAAWALAGSWFLIGVDGDAAPVLAAAMFAGLLVLGVLALGADRMRRQPRRPRRRLGRLLDDIAAGLAAYRRQGRMVGTAVTLSVVSSGLNIASMVLFADAIGVGIAWQVVAVSIPLTMAATLLPITVNGLGVREGVLVGLLARAGVATAGGAAIALFLDLQALPVAMLGGALYVARRRPPRIPARPVAAEIETVAAGRLG